MAQSSYIFKAKQEAKFSIHSPLKISEFTADPEHNFDLNIAAPRSTMFLHLLLPLLIVKLAHQNEVKILRTHSGETGPAPCALLCSGVARWDEWIDYPLTPGKAIMMVPIAECNFVSTPIVTVRLGGDGQCPDVVVIVSQTYFVVRSVADVRAHRMKGHKCDIDWIATGFNC